MIILGFQFLVFVYVLGWTDDFLGISDVFSSNLGWLSIWFTNFLTENFLLLTRKLIL